MMHIKNVTLVEKKLWKLLCRLEDVGDFPKSVIAGILQHLKPRYKSTNYCLPFCDFQAIFLCIQHTVSKWFKARNSSWWVCCDWLKRQKCLSYGGVISLVCWNWLVSFAVILLAMLKLIVRMALCVLYGRKINLPISLQSKQNSVLGFVFDFIKFILWIVQPL